jgi:hypothetical protein
MNYNSMTDLELLHYLDIYSDDPLIRRLVDVLGKTRGALLTDLENAGMDPDTWMFRTDWQSMYPGDYIIHLEKQLQYSEEELSGLQYRYDDLLEDRDRLKTRSIMDFVEEVKQEQRANQELVRESVATVQAFKKENERLKEQIDMWGRMNQPERKLS